MGKSIRCAKHAGTDQERRALNYFKKLGYEGFRSYGSAGPFDLFMYKKVEALNSRLAPSDQLTTTFCNERLVIMRRVVMNVRGSKENIPLTNIIKIIPMKAGEFIDVDPIELINYEKVKDNLYEVILEQHKKNEGFISPKERYDLQVLANRIGATALYGSNTILDNKLYFYEIA